MKNNKFISGKASLVILLTILVASFALLFNSITKVSASVTSSPSPTGWHDGHDNDCKDHKDREDCKDHSPSPTPTQKPCDKDGHFDFSFNFGRGGKDGKDCPTPTPTATPEPSATPGDVCWNLDGFQGSIPDGYHKDTPDGACNQYQLGGAPPPPPVTGSGTGGQVLGASTMAGTGSFDENLYMAIMGLGAIITFAGFKNIKKII